jgi:hypothetical protein
MGNSLGLVVLERDFWLEQWAQVDGYRSIQGVLLSNLPELL